MIQQLQNAFNETLDALYDLPEDYLQEGCGHAWCPRRLSTGPAGAQHLARKTAHRTGVMPRYDVVGEFNFQLSVATVPAL